MELRKINLAFDKATENHSELGQSISQSELDKIISLGSALDNFKVIDNNGKEDEIRFTQGNSNFVYNIELDENMEIKR
jgi:hypothetical protein